MMDVVVISLSALVLVFLAVYAVYRLSVNNKKSYEQTQEQMAQVSNFETLPSVEIKKEELAESEKEKIRIVLDLPLPIEEFLGEEPVVEVKPKKKTAKKKISKKKTPATKKTQKKRKV